MIISFLVSWDEICVLINFTTVFHYFYSWYLLKTVKESLLLSHVSRFIGVCCLCFLVCLHVTENINSNIVLVHRPTYVFHVSISISVQDSASLKIEC